jgi:hypothetical protein
MADTYRPLENVVSGMKYYCKRKSFFVWKLLLLQMEKQVVLTFLITLFEKFTDFFETSGTVYSTKQCNIPRTNLKLPIACTYL